MKKKIKSLVVILAALMLFSVVQVFDFVRAKADEMPLIETITYRRRIQLIECVIHGLYKYKKRGAGK